MSCVTGEGAALPCGRRAPSAAFKSRLAAAGFVAVSFDSWERGFLVTHAPATLLPRVGELAGGGAAATVGTPDWQRPGMCVDGALTRVRQLVSGREPGPRDRAGLMDAGVAWPVAAPDPWTVVVWYSPPLRARCPGGAPFREK